MPILLNTQEPHRSLSVPHKPLQHLQNSLWALSSPLSLWKNYLCPEAAPYLHKAHSQRLHVRFNLFNVAVHSLQLLPKGL